MKIELKEIQIRDLYNGYKDSGVDGVVGYDGKLDIRPPFQREFIYNEKQRNAVIDTVRKGFPLNVMYWSKNPNEDSYELLDGQQRTISICQYVNGDFSIDYQFFFNLTNPEQEQILEYPLMVYVCEGTEKEKLEWFKTINIAGVQLADQELRNAVYTGTWLADAKRHFSKPNCVAYNFAKEYMSGNVLRQDYLETAIKWIASKDGKEIEDYMAEHQHDKDSAELWQYFQQVINWVKIVYPKYNRLQKGIDWGIYYNDHKDDKFNANDLADKVGKLLMDDDVTNKKGIFEYLIDGKEKHLSIRAFTDSMKMAAYERQKGICPKCGKYFEYDEMQGDHIKPWVKGGKTIANNCQMLCQSCNATKSDK